MTDIRANLARLMERTVNDQDLHGNWRYLAVRPQEIPAVYPGPARTVFADCSDGCRMLARWAGVKDDPAGNGYQPYGNSSSIWAHCEHIDLADAKPGDMAVFGYSSGEKHACMLWMKDAYGWWVWNMGTQGQPAKRKLSDEIAAHAGMTMTICHLPVVDPPPTPEDQLRAKTGFYAWVAWRLSEGPWRGRPKADKTVRPKVPKLIPPAWWKNYVAFLAARKKANP